MMPIAILWSVRSPQLFLDNFAKREILSLPVCCHGDKEGCLWKGELRHLRVRACVRIRVFLCMYLANEERGKKVCICVVCTYIPM